MVIGVILYIYTFMKIFILYFSEMLNIELPGKAQMLQDRCLHLCFKENSFTPVRDVKKEDRSGDVKELPISLQHDSETTS